MAYHFYGWESADRVKAGNPQTGYAGIRTPLDLYDALSDIWCAETCAPRMRAAWSPENKTLGQCSITAFLAQDIFGGEVYGLVTESGDVHCYNVVDGYTFDLASEQFGRKAKDLVYTGNTLQDRESAGQLGNEDKRSRYELLCRKLAERK